MIYTVLGKCCIFTSRGIVLFLPRVLRNKLHGMWKRQFAQWAGLTKMTHRAVKYSALYSNASLAQIWGCCRTILPVNSRVVKMQFIKIILLDMDTLQ